MSSRPPSTDALADARREVAVAHARLAELAVAYADERIAADRAEAEPGSRGGVGRARPGEFVADEVSLVLREQPYAVTCQLAQTRRLTKQLPTVWEAFVRGELP